MQIKEGESSEQCLQLFDGKRGSSAHDLSLHTLPPAIGDLAIQIDPLDASSHLLEWSTKSTKVVIGPSSSLTSKEVHVLLSHNHDGEQSTNKFMLPFARTNLDKTAWDAPSSNFGETCYTTCYWEWAEDVLSGHRKVLLDAKVYDAVHASLFTYDYCDNTLHAFLELWCHTTNTLHSSTGELSISLWDLRKLGGLPIHGTFYDEVVPSADELCGTSVDGKSRLPASCIHLFSAFHKLTKRTKDVRIADWIQFWFKGQSRYQPPPLRVSRRRISSKPRTTHNPSGIIDNDYAFKINNKAEQFLDLGVDETSRDETYLAAFLSCWICKFLLPRHEIGHIRPSVFKVASLMACGQKFSLAVPVLSSIYNGLNEVVHSSKLRESIAIFPIHYLYAWIAHYFDAYHMHGKFNYGALMTKFGGEKMAKFFTADEARSLLLKMNPSILPSLCLAQEKNRVLVDNGDLSSSWIDYFISTRSCYLTLRLNNVHIVEPYNPCRFSRQFGFCQDVPYDLKEKLPPYSLVDIMQLWESSTRVATQSKITLPAQKVSFFVTKDYHHWWSSRSYEAPKHTIKINLKKRKSIESCAHLTSKSDVAIHSSHEHKSTKRSSSQNHSSVPYETGKGDVLDTSIKTLNDARETITKNSHKETEATPTQNSKGNLTEKEVNAPNEEQPSKAVVAVSANGGKTPLVIFSPQTLNATIGDLSCHNTCDKEESSESTSGRDRPWNRPKKGNKENNARDLDMSIIDSEALIQGVPSSTIPLEQLAQYFDDHEQRVDLVDDTLEEMEVSVTGPSKFDIFSNVVHTSLNANLTKNLDDGGNDVANSQAMIRMQNTIMTRRTPSIQTTLLKQPLKTFKPPTWPLPSTVSEFHSEEVISNCQREYVSMLWRNLKQQISKTSLEHMSSLNKHATRFLEEMGSKTDISALQGLIKTFFENIETYNSVKASFDGKVTQESYEGLLSTTQQNLRTIEMQEQEQVKSVEDLESQITQLGNKEAELKEQLEHLCAQREEKTMVLNQSREILKKAQVEVAGLREEIQKIENHAYLKKM